MTTSSLLEWFVGNRNPSITEKLTSDGEPVNLSSGINHVEFLARDAGGTALICFGTAALVSGGTFGDVRYDWTAGDIAPGGILSEERMPLVWWRVVYADGHTQDLNEALIRVSQHDPTMGDGAIAYVELEAIKNTLSLTGQTYADPDIRVALGAASRGIDEICDRRFYPDPDANQVRYYQASSPTGSVEIDDLSELTKVSIDLSGGTAFAYDLVANRDFTLEPLNAAADGKPWEELCLGPSPRYYWPAYPRSVRVTGRFGWTYIPAGVQEACTILTTRLMRRMREAPFGVVTNMDGEAIRIARSDPDVAFALEPFRREAAYVG